MKKVLCPHCDTEMNYIGTKKLQLGETGWVLGDLPNLIAGAMEVDIYTCASCGKIEVFMPEDNNSEIGLRECPNCGKKHEFDDPKCPFCKYDYYNK